MKKHNIIAIVLLMSMFVCADVEAKRKKRFWDTGFGRFLKGTVETVATVAVDRCVEKYAPEESKRYKKETGESFGATILSACGASQENIQRGVAWNEAPDKYAKQNIIKDELFNIAGQVSGQEEVFEKLRQINTAQLECMSELSRATTQEERDSAINRRNRAYFDIGWDTYHEAKKRRAKHVAEKLKVSKKLQQNGWDENLAYDVASNIIAIQNSNIPEEEKSELLRSYGYSDMQEIENVVNEVLSTSDEQLDLIEKQQAVEAARIAEQKRIEEEKRKEEERRKAEEVRKEAIKSIQETIVSEYAFDTTELSQTQLNDLDSVASILNKYAELKLKIVGHTCKIGYKNINLSKGLRRAESAKAYLVEKGIAEERILCESKGELEPIVKNNSKENMAKNRRLEFVISE